MYSQKENIWAIHKQYSFGLFPQNMKWGVVRHTFFEKSNKEYILSSRVIISFHAKSQVI